MMNECYERLMGWEGSESVFMIGNQMQAHELYLAGFIVL